MRLSNKEFTILRIAESLVQQDMFGDKQEYIYDPKHEKPAPAGYHKTPKGYGLGTNDSNNQSEFSFGEVPKDKIERTVDIAPKPKSDLFSIQTPVAQEPIAPTNTPIQQPAVQAVVPSVQEPTKPAEEVKPHEQTVIPEAHKDLNNTNSGSIKDSVKTIARKFGANKSIENVDQSILKTIGNSIKHFDDKGIETIMSVSNPKGETKKVAISHSEGLPENFTNSQTYHAIGTAYAIASGIASDKDFQLQAKKAMQTDMDNFIEKYSDMPYPITYKFEGVSTDLTDSPAELFQKNNISNPKIRQKLFQAFTGGQLSSAGDKQLAFKGILGAMQSATRGEYGHGNPQQEDDDDENITANMAGYVLDGAKNTNPFFRTIFKKTTEVYKPHLKF